MQSLEHNEDLMEFVARKTNKLAFILLQDLWYLNLNIRHIFLLKITILGSHLTQYYLFRLQLLFILKDKISRFVFAI